MTNCRAYPGGLIVPQLLSWVPAKDREDDRIYKDGFAFLVPPLEKGRGGFEI